MPRPLQLLLVVVIGGAAAWVVWDSSKGGESISVPSSEESPPDLDEDMSGVQPGSQEPSGGDRLTYAPRQEAEASSSELQWWEDEALLEQARQGYAEKLAEVRGRVDGYGERQGGEVHIRKALDTGAALFLSQEFPIQLHEIEADGYLEQSDVATALNRLYVNFRDYGIDVDETDAVNYASLVTKTERDPWSFVPAVLAEVSLPSGEYRYDSDFIEDAKSLYLEFLPSVGDAKRQVGIGETAAVEALLAAGLERDRLNNAFEHFRIISPEAIAGHAVLDSLRVDFRREFSQLVDRYYSR